MTPAARIYSLNFGDADMAARMNKWAARFAIHGAQNSGRLPDTAWGWADFNTALHEVRRRLLGIDGPTSWGGSREETTARLRRYILSHRRYSNPGLP